MTPPIAGAEFFPAGRVSVCEVAQQARLRRSTHSFGPVAGVVGDSRPRSRQKPSPQRFDCQRDIQEADDHVLPPAGGVRAKCCHVAGARNDPDLHTRGGE